MRTFMRVLAAVGLGAAVLDLTGAAAFADSRTDKVGLPSGSAFEADCPAGTVVTGWAYNYGVTLVALAPMCANFVDGRLTGAPPVADPNNVKGGEDGATGTASYACNAERGPVQKLIVYTTAEGPVHSFKTQCHPLGNKQGSVSGATKTTGAVAATAHATVGCATGSYATGVFGTYKSNGIQSLGLICHDGNEPTEDQPTNDTADTGDQDNGDNGFQVRINIGPGGLNFGAKGKRRTVTDDTEIFSDRGDTEIGTLEAGDRVTALGCEKKGKGWCQIIDPMPGLVWGGDLK